MIDFTWYRHAVRRARDQQDTSLRDPECVDVVGARERLVRTLARLRVDYEMAVARERACLVRLAFVPQPAEPWIAAAVDQRFAQVRAEVAPICSVVEAASELRRARSMGDPMRVQAVLGVAWVHGWTELLEDHAARTDDGRHSITPLGNLLRFEQALRRDGLNDADFEAPREVHR